MKYDIIGDIHGQADELISLLDKMGYQINKNGIYQHESRQLIFLGDFVDRGNQQRKVIDIVRPMVDSGSAIAVMGNHEFNAIAYYLTNSETGKHLRIHSEKNQKQHQAFLDEYEAEPLLYESTINWFMTLPLWIDLDCIKVIHACWDSSWIERLKSTLVDGKYVNKEIMRRASDPTCWEFEAIETVLKGKEIPLKTGHSFFDKDGNERHNIRVRWWDQAARTYKTAFMGPESAITHIPDDEIVGDHLVEYLHEESPVFLGHYWLSGDPEPLATNIACVDYSVAKPGGKLVAYRWDGESSLSNKKYVWVNRL